jgi:tetratricopeptide (TPR) repeat protein
MWHRPAALIRLCGTVAFLAASSLGAPAEAQVPAPGAEATVEAEPKARAHFQAALEQYRAGQYTHALASLREAATLDPHGKDLFFNLALVHEKLGQLPEAVAALERFRELEPDEAEREKARLTISRLRGAEREKPQVRESVRCPELPLAPQPQPQPQPPPPPSPNLVLIGAGSLAIASLVVGAVFGVKALSEDVDGVRTSSALSLGQLRERARRAERAALLADLSFALAAASAGTFAAVWVLSPTQPTQRAAGISVRSYF